MKIDLTPEESLKLENFTLKETLLKQQFVQLTDLKNRYLEELAKKYNVEGEASISADYRVLETPNKNED